MQKVSIIRANDSTDIAVRTSAGLVGGLDINKDDTVVLKPNICNSKNPAGMVNTDIRVIESVVELVKEYGCEIKIVESDNISGTADRRVKESGYLDFFNELGVEFLNLSNDDFIEYSVADTILRIPLTVTEADYFINIPKIKTCAHTLVTLGIKNLYGVFQRRSKGKLHKYLDEILPFLASTIRNDLIIVDGLTCMEGNGPVIGTPRCLDVIISGKNLVSVDSVCSMIMGYNPGEIPHIALSAAKGLGPTSLDEIEIIGTDLGEFTDGFEPPYSLRATLGSLKSIKDIYLG
ncbi:DUF362 domain-containing protein [Candidatus Bathyarchaeota archaeon]|nr:DUF362 domain-containing protein [Candidatus Bathyarchaeota archaeon]